MSAVQQESLVANAADRQQVRDAKTVETRRSNDALKDQRELAKLAAYLRQMRALIEFCDVLGAEECSNEQQQFAAGKRMVGVWALKRLREASPDGYYQTLTGDIR